MKKPNVIRDALEKIEREDGRSVTITRCGGGRRTFRDANYLVRGKGGTGRSLDDGTYWDGWETVGHYKIAQDAAAAALDYALPG